MKYVTTIGDCEYSIEVVDETHVVVNGRMYEVDFDHVGTQPVYSLLVDGASYEAYVYEDEEEWQVLMRGRLYPARVEDEREKRLRAAAGSRVSDRGEFHLKAPMPGLVVAIPVTEGQDVETGEVLV
ncbi:MAG TPA: biotin/lipoyl-binding protein, partial [Anaerolineales bacterium]|nr:biotin/lipoyl-binding protein [Anaerolineales bacterium]